MKLIIFMCLFSNVLSLHENEIRLSVDFYKYKAVSFLCYFTCENQHQNKLVVQEFIRSGVRVSTVRVERTEDVSVDGERTLRQWNVDIGVLLDGACEHTQSILRQASEAKLFGAEYIWLILTRTGSGTEELQYIQEKFQDLNLHIDADITVSSRNGTGYALTDVFNFGRLQGNHLEISSFGSWRSSCGLSVALEGFKYYRRWDFHNLTLRAVSVVVGEKQKDFNPELLYDIRYTPGIAAMTKIGSQLLRIMREKHNFRFNITISGRWVGSPVRNTTMAVTNSLFWGEQDVASTSARIFPQWLQWVDVAFPPTTHLETKFYYLIPNKGVGAYENRFLTPMSPGVWWCTLAACLICAAVLAVAAFLEMRPKPGLYAFFSVYAALCQQGYDDGGAPTLKYQSQGKKMVLLVVGLTCMLLYNYYTSSVVSWLLSAARPSIMSLDALINSDLEVIFEDTGYSRGWLDPPKNGFVYYLSGNKNLKEEELKEKKVTKAKRTVEVLQPIESGLEMIRHGAFAYHTEPYTARQAIGKFTEDELCELGALTMMRPNHAYIMVQKRSPYKQFFTWTLMRLYERGHIQASRQRFAGTMPKCSGRRPRALALGQAAPAFALLLQLMALSVLILLAELLDYRLRKSRAEWQKRPFYP